MSKGNNKNFQSQQAPNKKQNCCIFEKKKKQTLDGFSEKKKIKKNLMNIRDLANNANTFGIFLNSLNKCSCNFAAVGILSDIGIVKVIILPGSAGLTP